MPQTQLQSHCEKRANLFTNLLLLLMKRIAVNCFKQFSRSTAVVPNSNCQTAFPNVSPATAPQLQLHTNVQIIHTPRFKSGCHLSFWTIKFSQIATQIAWLKTRKVINCRQQRRGAKPRAQRNSFLYARVLSMVYATDVHVL